MSIPIYQQIKDVLKEEIKQGKYKPGDVLPSVNQLAKMFSTSRNTAVKAIADLAHEGTIYCVQGKGSVVNDFSAKQPQDAEVERPRRKNSSILDIGILIADFDNIHHPYFVKLLQGISKQAQDTPYNLKMFCINNCSITDFLETEIFDGLIVATELPSSSIFLLKQRNIPFVLANNDIYGEDLYCVTIDSYSFIAEAIKYLNSLGHKDICVISGPYNARSTPLSYIAYKQTMNELNLDVDEALFKSSSGYSEEDGYNIFKHLLDQQKRPTAVIALDDYIANGVMKAAEENSIKVPDQLSVIGNGDILPESNLKIPLTTASGRLEEVGALCLEIIGKQLQGIPVEKNKISLKPEIIIRKSCMKI